MSQATAAISGYGGELTVGVEAGFAKINELALRDGVEVELVVEMGDSLNLSVNEGRIEKFDAAQSLAGGIRVIRNGVEGYCWTESIDEADRSQQWVSR